MALTYFLAQIFGIALLATAVTLFLERKMMMEVIHGLVENRALLYVLGVFDLILGLAIVLTHNVWDSENALVTTVTALGWLLLIKGIARMTMPSSTIKRYYKSKGFVKMIPLVGLIALVVGAWLTYEGFRIGY